MLMYLKDRIQGKAPKGARRSPTWRKTRRAFLKVHPRCENCGSTKKLQVHHVISFHVAPEIEEDWNNMMVLCTGRKMNCHLVVGHNGNYRDINPNARAMAAYWLEIFTAEPQQKPK